MNKFELFKNFNLELIELIKSLEKDLLSVHNKAKTSQNNQGAQVDPKNNKSPLWRFGRFIGSVGQNKTENIIYLYKNRKNSLLNYNKFQERFEQIISEIKNNIILENTDQEIPEIISKFKLNLNSIIAKYAAELQSDWEDEREDQIKSSGHEDRSDDEIERLHTTGGAPSPEESSISGKRTIPIDSGDGSSIIQEFSKLDSETKVDILIKAILFHYHKENPPSDISIPPLSILLAKSKEFERAGGVMSSIVDSLSEKEYEDYENKLKTLFPS